MWLESKVFYEDLKYILKCESIEWEKFMNKTILITGGTGLIGSTLISALVYADGKLTLNLKILALVRNEDKATVLFASQLKSSNALKFIIGSVDELPNIDYKIDYIVHGACPTASAFFIDKPVETINTSVKGTMSLLELAKKNLVKGFNYLSSMEVYGEVINEGLLNEDILGFVNPLIIRSCYPESKRMCETICNAYAKEYGLQTTSIRLAQTFGPGVAYNDKRVFAMMARCAIKLEDIVLQTQGTSKHPYLYTAQAITAILTVLFNGESGRAYNAANPETYCSIYEMGEIVAKELTNGKITVKIASNGDVRKYPAPSFLNLDISAIKNLGWKSDGNLVMMYKRMMEMM